MKKEDIEKLLSEIQALECKTAKDVEDARVRLLGKKGVITALFEEFRTVDKEVKKELGRPLNELKQAAAAKIEAAPAVGTVAKAIANLSDEASNPVIIMNKLTWAEFKAAQYANGYGVDPFEGLTVLFNNSLNPASEGGVYMIVGDLGYGAIANFPNGDSIEFIFDEVSRKKEDMVEVLGREYAGIGVVASKAFVLVAAPLG